MVNDWSKGVDAPQNVVLISIASVVDPSMAPEGAEAWLAVWWNLWWPLLCRVQGGTHCLCP